MLFLILGKSEEQEDEFFKCIDCLSGVAPACFICNEREGDRIRCSVLACGKHYHSSCLKSWPQVMFNNNNIYNICIYNHIIFKLKYIIYKFFLLVSLAGRPFDVSISHMSYMQFRQSSG